MIKRGRNSKKELNDLQEFKIDIDYPKIFSRSKSLANMKMKNISIKDFQTIKEEQTEDEKEINCGHCSFAHKNKTCNDFYKIHHRDTLPIEKISPNEDLVTSEYFKNILSSKTKKSSCSSTTYDEFAQDKIEDIDKEYNSESKKLNLEGVFNENNIESDLEFSEKTNSKNIYRNKFDYEEIDVIKEEMNENEKIEES